MTMLVRPSRFRMGADTAIGLWLGDEQRGLAIDFLTMEAVVRDDDAPVGSFYGLPSALLTNTTPPTKFLFDINGVLVSGSNMRTEYDPVSHVPMGLLIEEARTNQMLRSQEFDNASWVKASATVSANATTAPDGTTTADKLIEDVSAALEHKLSQTWTATAVAWTASCYCKAGERSWVYLRIDTGTALGAFFNLATGAVGTVGGGITAVIKPAGSGWYKCSVTRTLTVASYTFAMHPATADTAYIYAGDGASGLYVWGGQVEIGGYPSSYIPTTTIAVTRARDNITLSGASLPLTPSVGTALVEFAPVQPGTAGAVSVFDLDRTASGEQSRVHVNYGAGSNINSVIKDTTGATVAAGAWAGASAPGVVDKVALTWADNDFAYCNAGTTVQVDASGAAPNTYDRLVVHGNYFSTSGLFHLRRIKILNRRASNAELQAMTV